MKNPIISIIIPIYNCEEFIEECLDSIINQNCSFDLFELILVDDLSPCKASKIVKDKYLAKFSNIKLFESKEKLGPGGARNKGIKEATSPYVTFIDGDDWYTKDFYEVLVKSHLNNESDITVAGMINTIDGRTVRWDAIPPKGTYTGSKKLDLLWDVKVECHSPYRIYNKTLFSEKGVWFKENAFYEDTAIMPELFLEANKITCLDTVVYNYRYNPSSIVNTSSNKHITDINNSVRHLLQKIPVNKKGIRFIWWLYYHNIFKKRWDYISTVKAKDYREFMDGFLSNLKDFPFMIYQSETDESRSKIEHTIEILDQKHKTNYSNQFSEFVGCDFDQNPLVSIIMPNYNNSDCIKESILSVLNQSYTNIELIVIDDCSTDHSVKEIKKIKDHRLKLIELEENSKTYFARNTGIKNALGTIISNVDSDDIISKNRIENVVNHFRKHPHLKLVETRFIRYFADTKLIEPRKFTQGVPHGFYRREVFSDIGYFHPVKSGGDSEFSERTRKYYGDNYYSILNDFTFFCKILPTSLTSINPQGSQNREEYIKFYRKLHETSFNQLYCEFPWTNTKPYENLDLYSFKEYPKNLKIKTTGDSVYTPDKELYKMESDLQDLQLQTLAYYYQKNIDLESNLEKAKHNSSSDKHQRKVESENSENKEKLKYYIEENNKLLQHYKYVYEAMPTWWKKIGSFIRKLKKKK